MTEIYKTGEKIRRLRLMRGLSQIELREKAGCGLSLLSKFENDITGGRQIYRKFMLRRIAEALKVELEYLLDETKPYPTYLD